MQKVMFLPRYVAEGIDPTGKSAAIISINCDSSSAKLHKNWKHVLYLEFHDLDKVISGYTLFNEDHARKVLDFLEEVKGVHTVVVHCGAGISRSAAVAKFVSEKYDVPFISMNGQETNYTLYNKLVYSMLRYVDSGGLVY